MRARTALARSSPPTAARPRRTCSAQWTARELEHVPIPAVARLQAQGGAVVTATTGSDFVAVRGLRQVGQLSSLAWDVLRYLPRRPLQVREYVQQAWFFA